MTLDVGPLVSTTIELPDGRKLGFSHLGDSSGRPLFFFHGFGVSRLAAYSDQAILRTLGIHIIAVDRPGIGLSDPQPNRTILHWADDIAVLADALQIAEFAVLGWSAGGPHALACAYKMSERITATGVVSCAPPFSDEKATRSMPANVKQLALVARIAPWLIRISFWQHRRQILQDAKRVMAKAIDEMVPSDQAIATDPRFEDTIYTSMVTACNRTSRGLADDVLAVARPWGFELADITLPVHLWHGEADQTIPPEVGRYLASAIPNCHAVYLSGEGHFLYLKYWSAILTPLCP